MRYEKPALTFEEQADQLIERGLLSDRAELLSRLRSVSYYRLSGYWFPFLLPDQTTFADGTTLEEIWSRYTFDRRFRLIVLDAIERVEVCVRTELVYLLAHSQGPFGYVDVANVPGMSSDDHAKFLGQLDTECARSREPFIAHFKNKYGDEHPYPPYWMATELMTFGTLLSLFRAAPPTVKKQIARRFGTDDTVFVSWMLALNAVRNTCAHHGRLWNRELGCKPKIPNKDRRWHDPIEVSNNRVFGIVTILKSMLSDIAQTTKWSNRLNELLAEYPAIPIAQMGFPDGWQSCPFWAA